MQGHGWWREANTALGVRRTQSKSADHEARSVAHGDGQRKADKKGATNEVGVVAERRRSVAGVVPRVIGCWRWLKGSGGWSSTRGKGDERRPVVFVDRFVARVV